MIDAKRDLPGAVRWLLFIGPAVLAAWTAHAIYVTYAPVPFNDQWVMFYWWREIRHGMPLWPWIASQHNEHRILFPRLIFLADLKWFEGRNVLNLATIGLIQVLGAGFYVRMAWAERRSWLASVGMCVAVSMIFLLLQWENFFWGFQVQFVGVYVAAAWCAGLFFQACEDRSRPKWGLLAASGALLMVATYTMSNGLFVGIAILLAAALGRQSLRAIALMVLATTVLLLVYLHGYHAIPDHSAPAFALHHPGRYLSYLLTYLGNILAPGEPPKARFIGGLGVLATFAMVLVVLRTRMPDRSRLSLLAVVLFVGLSAGATSLGRLSFGIEQSLSSRYMTPTSHFWAAQALFWSLTAARTHAAVLRRGVGLVLAFLYVLVLHLQALAQDGLMATRERILRGSSALVSGVADVVALKGIYPELTMIQDLTPFLRRERLSVFARDPGLRLGARFQSPAIALGQSGCFGAFDRLDADAAQPGIWRAYGWGWDDTAGRRFDRVILVDDAGAVRGVGLSGMPRPDVDKAVRQVRTGYSGWIASVAEASGPRITPYGLMRDGSACNLGSKPWVR